MKLRSFLLGAFAFPFLCSGQAKLVEKVDKISPDEIVIPYQKYLFPNGLILLVHEDHSDPIVHVDVTYHVGSAREEIGKSGFAHFFEHMMFQGSDNVADEQHFKLITEVGGTLNGSTNRDRTNYFETVPNNQLEKMLWLESDRMGFFVNAVTQKKFEIQRATVKNERGQNYDNRPYGLVQETLSKNMYPYGHPYSWLTIGYVEDLNRVNVQDLKNFFLRWYGPNNAVLTIGGDVKTAEVVKLVEKYFGSIPQCPKVEKTILPIPVIDKDRYVNMVDGYAKTPMLQCAFVGVPSFHKDAAALDCLSDILGGGTSSIFYQRLVKTQKALRANTFSQNDELAGTFQLSVMPKPGTSLSDMEKEVRAALSEFETRGVTDDDISKFRQVSETRKIYRLERVAGKVSQLAAFQTYTGNANYIKEDLKSSLSVTKEDVIRVYNQYLKGKKMVILSVLTKGNESIKAAENNYKIDSTSYKAPNYGYNGLTYTKGTENFDRKAMPPSGPNPFVKVPEFKRLDADGIKTIFSKSDEIPVVTIEYSFKGGNLLEQKNLDKAGLSSFFAEMMEEDTKKYSKEELDILLEKLGGSISFGISEDAILLTVSCLKKNLKPILDLVEERVLNPKFTVEAFERIKTQNIEAIKNAKAQAANVVGNAYRRLNYGKGHMYGWSSNGTEATLSAIQLGDIEAYYKNNLTRDGLKIVVGGDVSEAEVLDIRNRMKKVPDIKTVLPVPPAVSTANPPSKIVYVVNVPKAAQTEFRIGYGSNLIYDATGEFYRCGLMNFPLGGAFNSRVNLNLRENKGWTYGARSGFGAGDFTGNYTFSSGIKAAATDSALVEVLRELSEFGAKGMTPQELAFLKSSIGLSEARNYETGGQKARFIGNILQHNLPVDFVDQQNKILKDITVGELNTLAKKWIVPEKMRIVLAGDKERIAPGIEKLGYRIVELDTEGEPVTK